MAKSQQEISMFPTFNSKAAKGFIKNAIWLAIPVCLVLLLATSALAEESITKSTSPGPAESNTACEKCHMDIFSYWNQSRHNQSTTNVFYKQALQEFQKLQDVSKLPRGKDFCKTCHEPLLATGGNDKAANGVQCEFCHSIKDVQLGRRPSPFILEKGPTKYGPLGEVQSPAHPTRKSELFSTSLLCAGCHEWKNDAGLSILSTYSEWQESGLQKEDTHCQSCHMAEVEGQVSDPKLSRITSGKVNTHQFTGGHTASQLHKAVSIKIKDISIEKEDLTVRLEVRNIGSGHYFPTGMPTRRVEIEVSVKTAGSEPEVKNQILARRFVDQDGKPVLSAHEIFHRAAKLLSDTRLKPDETREFAFSFKVVPKGTKQINTRLIYYDDPLPGIRKPFRTVFFQKMRKR